MAVRFTDDFFKHADGSDFIVRRRLPLALQIFVVFSIAFLAIYTTATVMYDTGSKTLFFSTLTLTLGTLAWATIYFSARLRDLVLATEFQNAMLASAAQLSTRFCLITKADGLIVYVDPGFQALFPHFMRSSDRTIDNLLASAGIPQDVIQKVILQLEQNRNDRVLLPLRKDSGEPMPLMMSVEVLPRPKGYFLLRGRDYVENRNASFDKSTQMQAEGALAQTLNILMDGVLVTDGAGGILFANRLLEEALGFEPGEMAARPLKAGQIIYQYGGMDAGRLISTDFEGEAVLQRKDRSLIAMFIRQVSLGKGAGTSAILTLPQPAKKK